MIPRTEVPRPRWSADGSQDWGALGEQVKPLLSFEEAAALMNCSLKEVRRQVIEHRTFQALLITPEGYRRKFAMGNLPETRYIVNDDGLVKSHLDHSELGYLRLEYGDVLGQLTDVEPHRLRTVANYLSQVSTESLAPTEVLSASLETVPAQRNNEPLPLTTGDIAHCFDGLRWSESEWKKPLSDKPKWLRGCIVIPGRRGVSETRWNPVLIGAALIQAKHVNVRTVRAKFRTVDLLRPWFDEWKDYEADHFDKE